MKNFAEKRREKMTKTIELSEYYDAYWRNVHYDSIVEEVE